MSKWYSLNEKKDFYLQSVIIIRPSTGVGQVIALLITASRMLSSHIVTQWCLTGFD